MLQDAAPEIGQAVEVGSTYPNEQGICTGKCAEYHYLEVGIVG